MITWIIRTLVSLAACAALLYVIFCVPFGELTLAEHVVRIAHTDEAQDLEKELQKKGQELQQAIQKKR